MPRLPKKVNKKLSNQTGKASWENENKKTIFVRLWTDITSEHTEYQLREFADKHGENASKADRIS